VTVHHGRMVRAFAPDPIDPAALARVLDAGRRAPAAGNTAEGRAFVVLERPASVEPAADGAPGALGGGGGPDDYWDVALPAGPRRDGFAWPGLLRAPVLVVVCARPAAWAERYAEADKGRAANLGRGADAWPQPFWWFDAGAATEAMLLAARAEGLGACLFGLFEREVPVLDALGVPAGWRGAAVVALGHRDPAGDPQPGRSAARPRPPLDEVAHRGRW
jgi:FMN reductase [NAD(P)H]